MSSQMGRMLSSQRAMVSAKFSATTEALRTVEAAAEVVDSVAVVDAAMARAVAAGRDKEAEKVVPIADLVHRRLKHLRL